MKAPALPRSLGLSWWMVMIWIIPALTLYVYDCTIVSWRTGAPADALIGFPADGVVLIVFFGIVPLAVWILAAFAFVIAARARRRPVAGRAWVALSIAVGALALSRVPPNAWASATMRLAGPGRLGNTMLSKAVMRRDTPEVARLLAAGVDVNASTSSECSFECGFGETPLMNAARTGDVTMMSYLIAHGANASTTKPGGESPLFRAIAARSVPAVELLLAHGADPGPMTEQVKGGQVTPLSIAEYERDTAIIRLLKAASAAPRHD